MTFREAIREALRDAMKEDSSVLILGEDIGVYGGAFGVTKGLLEEFGEDRVIDTPISEASMMGVVTGLSLMGFKPVFEIMFMDFTTLIMDQVLNHATKFKYMFGGRDYIKTPFVIRTPYGGGRAYGASHSQSLEAFFMHIPGIKVAAPYTPSDAYHLLKGSIFDEYPVLFLENKLLYNKEGDVGKPLPFGKARLLKEGRDITFISYGRMLDLCIKASSILAGEGYSCEIIDLRTLIPWDVEMVCESVKKTSKAIVVEEGTLTGGVGSEIASCIMDECFYYLEAPVKRVASLDVPIPYSPPLENEVLPKVSDIVMASLEVLNV